MREAIAEIQTDRPDNVQGARNNSSWNMYTFTEKYDVEMPFASDKFCSLQK